MDRYNTNDLTSYILGISLTIEALKKLPQEIVEVFISSKAIKNAQYEKLVALCQANQIPLIEDDKTIDKLSVKENCYGIGVFKKFKRSLQTESHLVLYRFNDYGELGTIMRSAVSFNFKDIVLIDCDIDYFNPKVVRASMGSIFHLNICEYASIAAYLKDYPYHLYPFISQSTKELKTLKLQKPYSLLIPQNYYGLDELYADGYHLAHQGLKELSLSSLSSIVLNYCYDQNEADIGNVDKAQD